MKVINILIPIFVILTISLSYSQVVQVGNSELLFSSFWDFYSYNRLSTSACGKGYTGIGDTNGIDGVILNPASLSIGDRYQFYFEYIYKNNVQWLKGLFDNLYLKELHPTFLIGAGFNLNDYLSTGIVYCTNNSYKMDSIESAITDEYGNIIDSVYIFNELKISSFLIPIIFSYKDIIKLGVNLSYSNYTSRDIWIEKDTGKVSFNKFIPKFGVIVFPLKNLSIGLTYLPETKETITKKWTNREDEEYQPNVFPLRFGVGIQYELNAIPISFSLDYNYSNDSKDIILENRKDIHFGLEYDIIKNLALRAGFFSQRDYRSKNINWFDAIGDYDQIFTTLGLSYKITYFTLNLSMMNSNLFSKGKIEQTYINVGVNYNL